MLFHRLIGFFTGPRCSSSIAVVNDRRSRRRADDSVTAIVEILEGRKMLSAAPALGGLQSAFTFTESAPATPLAPTLTITETDSTTITRATVQIALNYYARGEDLLSFTNTPHITGSWNAATGTLTLSGTDTVANYQAALRSVSYQNLNAHPTNNVGRVFAVQVSDGVNASTFGFQGMYFQSTSAYLEQSDGTEVQGTPGTPLTNSVDLTPTTSGTFASVSVLDVYYTGDSGDQSSSNGTPSVPGNWYAASGTLVMSSSNPTANFQASARSVTYKNLNLDPSASPRFFQFVANYTVTPGSGSPADLPQYLFATDQGLNANPTNTAPVLSNVESDRGSYRVNSSPTKVTSTLSITDPDHTSLTSATVRIDTNYVNGQDRLTFDDTPRITGSWNAATGTLTLTGTDSIANYEAALRAVAYQNLSSNPNTLVRRFAFVTNDGLTDSTPAYRYFDIVA
ncbi:hypothetical protein [Schlesneria paludicola]|uniref:hypothetical protein n=1 Tax=Schlesneria paludicola TaxID=360056 RepID=UPI00029AF027|nr:hypothetical protein [Schlesneria paludicola]